MQPTVRRESSGTVALLGKGWGDGNSTGPHVFLTYVIIRRPAVLIVPLTRIRVQVDAICCDVKLLFISDVLCCDDKTIVTY